MQQLVAKPSLLIFVVVYVLVMVLVGAYYTKKSKTSDEFVKAGGGLGSIVLMGTFLATFTGNGTISGGGNSLAYTYGLWPGIFFAVPSLAGVVVLFLLAKKIREQDTYTVAGIIENKYGKMARTLSGAIIALSMISICAYQYKGLAFVLNVTTAICFFFCNNSFSNPHYLACNIRWIKICSGYRRNQCWYHVIRYCSCNTTCYSSSWRLGRSSSF